MSKKAIKVVLIDSYQMVRNGLKHLIEHQTEIRIVAEADYPSSAMQQIREHAPDLVLMNLHLSGADDLKVVKQMLEESPAIKVIVLSSESEALMIEEALEVGVAGFVLKENEFEEVVRAMRAALAGKLYLCPGTTTILMRSRQRKAVMDSEAGPKISEREKHLMRLISDGLHNKEIAAVLNVTPKSVETYRARLLKKLKCTSTSGLIRYAIREQIVVA